ncbi:MAG: hypothetical protein KDN20_23055, partial [Verrucomicrobiae bacterium]|nr:hypothetical protein [Verrucomicrobiae bacterium]
AYDPASEDFDVKFAEHDYAAPDAPSSRMFEPNDSEDVLVQGEERNGPFSKLFGKRKSKSIETGPVNGERAVVSPQSPGIPAWEDSVPPMGIAQT